VLSSRVKDLSAGLVTRFGKFEQLPGDEALEAPSDLTTAVALGGTSGGISPGVGIVVESRHRDGVQRAVELTVSGSVRADGG